MQEDFETEALMPTLKFMAWQLNGGGVHPSRKDTMQEEELGLGNEGWGQ